MDTNLTGVPIILAATRDHICPMMALRLLFTNNPQTPHALSFAFNNFFFSQQYVVDNFRARLFAREVLALRYSGHSFRRDEAQHAVDNKILDKDIQKFGR